MNRASERQQNKITQYLLGNLSDEAEMLQIEESLMTDDRFNEEFSIAEDSLIEDYLDGNLTADEERRFTNFFLLVQERREKLRLVENLRKYAAEKAARPVPQSVEEKRYSFNWRNLFSRPALQFAVLALIVAGLGFAVWRLAFYQSGVDKGLAEIQIAHRGQRPTESRPTIDLGYSAFTVTRGENEPSLSDANARRSAELLLLEAAKNPTDAEAHHALGLFYLTGKQLDEANKEFELAINLVPNNAQIANDRGAALYETAKKSLAAQDRAKGQDYLDQSIKYLERAITLNPKLHAPKFNLALSLQLLNAPEQAKQAWRAYLEADSTSQWADEARRNLQILESQKTQDVSAAELEQEFLAAARENNEEKAWLLLSRNRELIQEKYLPQRLAMSYLQSPDGEKENFLAALKYAGELEKKNTNDPFAAEIAGFYGSLPASKFDLLDQANNATRKGYEFSRGEEYKKAFKEFKFARENFLKAGDVWNAELSSYSIAYCLYNINEFDESFQEFSRIAEFCRAQNYRWLQQSAVHWKAGGYVARRKYTLAKNSFQEALEIAESIKDSYAVQKILIGLAGVTSSIGESQESVIYAQKALEESKAVDTSLRQKWRNYYTALKAAISAENYAASKFFGMETVRLAEENKNPMFITLSYILTGTAFIHGENYAEARRWLTDSLHNIETMSDESAKKKITAFSVLRLAHIERQTGNYDKSLQFYDDAINTYEELKLPFYLYEAHKGKLQTLLALENDAELEKQILITTEIAETYRRDIQQEQERNNFFNTEQSVYDSAIEYEFKRGGYETAYNYVEKSNSRSLLDWLKKGINVSDDKNKDLKILPEENFAPLTLPEIREQMPEKVQILQYSILENKILIWLISKDKFIVVPVEIKIEELREKVKNFSELLQNPNDSAQEAAGEAGRELFNLLIKPIYDQLDRTKETCLIPSKFLFHLSFAALISPKDEPLIKEFNILYSPSANVFLFCTKNALGKSDSPTETVLSVGNPAFDPNEFHDLENLPDAKGEAEKIAEFYDKSEVLTGKEATKTSFQNSLDEVEVLHFAGHYIAFPNLPMSSSLLLAKSEKGMENGVLTNSELVGVKLPRIKLVVLSACRTGVENYYNGEGLIGLSRTFLAAGTPMVVASQWKVESRASAELMKRFHFYRRQEKLSTAAALQKAQIEMLDAKDGLFKKPYYWAAFAAFGGYTTF